MSYGIVCRQIGCKAYARYRYTWPGQDESAICDACSGKLLGVANAMGMHVQLIPLTDGDHNNINHPLARTP